MKERSNRAAELHQKGYNCSQAVFAAFADLYNLDFNTALKLSTPFGGGLAGTRNLCGAVIAMGMIAGLETGTILPNDKEGKTKSFEYVNTLLEKFQQEHGSLLCKHLRGIEPYHFPVKIKPCREYVRYCAALLEQAIEKKEE